MASHAQRVADTLRLHRLIDHFHKIHLELDAWAVVHGSPALDKYRIVAESSIVRNNLRPHPKVPYPSWEGIAYLLLFFQRANTDLKVVQSLLDYSRNDSVHKLYYSTLTGHSFGHRAYELCYQVFHALDQKGLLDKVFDMALSNGSTAIAAPNTPAVEPIE